VYESAPRTVNVSYERKTYGKSDRQNDKEERAFPARHQSHQQVAEDADRYQKQPGSGRDTVPPGSLGVSLRIEHVIHARNDEGRYGCRSRLSGRHDCGPHFILQSRV
jgi:hypothetical protein